MAQRKRGGKEAPLARVRVGRRLQARRQSLIVPWKHFAATLTEYVEWFSFCLWARTTLEAEGQLSAGLERALQERVPGFLEQPGVRRIHGERASVRFWLRLLEWTHGRHFKAPERQGWLPTTSGHCTPPVFPAASSRRPPQVRQVYEHGCMRTTG